MSEEPESKFPEVLVCPVEVDIAGWQPLRFIPELGDRQVIRYKDGVSASFLLEGGRLTQNIEFRQGRFMKFSLRLNPAAPGGSPTWIPAEKVREWQAKTIQTVNELHAENRELKEKLRAATTCDCGTTLARGKCRVCDEGK